MAIPTNKDELINAIHESYQKLQQDIINIPEDSIHTSGIVWTRKNTTITLHNMISYLIWWWQLVLKWESIKSSWVEPIFPESWYKWNELWRLAQKFYSDYETLLYTELLELFNDTYKDIIICIEKYDNTSLYQEWWYEKWSLWRMIQLNTSSPYKNARTKIRRWKKENNI